MRQTFSALQLPFDFLEFSPVETLKPFVSRWVNIEFSHPDNDYLHKIAPSGRIIMSHGYGRNVETFTEKGEQIIYNSATYFKGHRLKEPLYLKSIKGIKEFACEFTYTGFYRLFHIAADRLVDIEYEISAFGLEDLEEALFSTTDLSEKCQIASVYFQSLIANALEPDIEVEVIVNAIESGEYQELNSLNNLNESAKKKIYRKFKKQTGLSIKQFKRIHQMNTAIKFIGSNDYDSLTELALKAGYYDQADFIRHVKQFFGQNPKELVKSEHDLLFQYMGGPKRERPESLTNSFHS